MASSFYPGEVCRVVPGQLLLLVEGLSVGAQIGFTEVWYIVILNTDEAVERFTSMGKTNWDPTASITVDTKSKTEKASIGDLEKADTIVYWNSDVVFA